MIGVIDYGAGNLQSVCKALRFIGCEVKVAGSPRELAACRGVVLPGVGSFGDAMEHLRAKGFDEAIRRWIAADKPFLGICLGMQVLFADSEESPGTEGLHIFEGRFRKFPPDMGQKVPHIGWNSLRIEEDGGLFRGIEPEPYVYFVHSYYLLAGEPIISARADYGISFDAAVQKGNTWACQFHPEKSGETGLAMLRNFGNLCGEE